MAKTPILLLSNFWLTGTDFFFFFKQTCKGNVCGNDNFNNEQLIFKEPMPMSDLNPVGLKCC